MSTPLDIRFFVPGRPIPKGNHDAFPIARGKCEDHGAGKFCRRRNCFGGTIVGTVVTDSKGDELKAWEAFVNVHAMSARNAIGARMVEPPGAVEVRLVFVLERPKGHTTKRGVLSAEGERKPLPTVKPDWDKLARATCDGLTNALVTDDAQLSCAMTQKVYGEKAGVLIRARTVTAPADWALTELAAGGIATLFSSQEGLFG